MGKTIKVSDGQLKKIVSESIRKILRDRKQFAININLSEIPIEDLRAGYKDYRLVPVPTMYGHVLYEPVTIKEAVGDIASPDEVVNSISNKYAIPKTLVQKKEAYHKVYIYAITAVIGVNDKLIEEDMNKLGNFLSVRGNTTVVSGMIYRILQFEPTSQLQEDITDLVKSRFNILYHWTPSYSVQSILTNGLIPNHKNTHFNYPPRTYLIEGDATATQVNHLGIMLCVANGDIQNNGKYSLLSVGIKGLDEAVRFFYDPNSEIGIYTEQKISSDNIKLIRTASFFEDV